MILLIDNYDSFSYNLYQLVGNINPDIRVVRNDELTVQEIRSLSPSHLIFSPGPGRPADAGICESAVRELAGEIPMLGVCLGHQAIYEAFGGVVTYAKELMHGKQSVVRIDQRIPIFSGLPESIPAARYHSLAADENTKPDCLQIIAETDDGEVMGAAHREYPIYGLQFHPESILTPQGSLILKNFLSIGGKLS